MHEHPAVKDIAQIQPRVRELRHFKIALPELDTLREANKSVQAFENSTNGLAEIRKTRSKPQNLRNTLAHTMPAIETIKPAYTLDEDDHG